MDAERILDFVLSEMSQRELEGCASTLKQYGKNAGLYVADDDAELRELALQQTDLVEPEEE